MPEIDVDLSGDSFWNALATAAVKLGDGCPLHHAALCRDFRAFVREHGRLPFADQLALRDDLQRAMAMGQPAPAPRNNVVAFRKRAS